MEFALVVPLLLTIILGGLTGGVVLNRKEGITHAAREGARYGATVPQNQCQPTSNCGGLTWAQLVRSVVVQRSVGNASNTQVCVALVTGSPGVVAGSTSAERAGLTTKSDGTPCYDDGSADPGLRVQVSIARTGDEINGVVIRIPVNLSAQSTARFEQ